MHAHLNKPMVAHLERKPAGGGPRSWPLIMIRPRFRASWPLTHHKIASSYQVNMDACTGPSYSTLLLPRTKAQGDGGTQCSAITYLCQGSSNIWMGMAPRNWKWAMPIRDWFAYNARLRAQSGSACQSKRHRLRFRHGGGILWIILCVCSLCEK
jgi:hypothetical protein